MQWPPCCRESSGKEQVSVRVRGAGRQSPSEEALPVVRWQEDRGPQEEQPPWYVEVVCGRGGLEGCCLNLNVPFPAPDLA